MIVEKERRMNMQVEFSRGYFIIQNSLIVDNFPFFVLKKV